MKFSCWNVFGFFHHSDNLVLSNHNEPFVCFILYSYSCFQLQKRVERSGENMISWQVFFFFLKLGSVFDGSIHEFCFLCSVGNPLARCGSISQKHETSHWKIQLMRSTLFIIRMEPTFIWVTVHYCTVCVLVSIQC